MTGKLWAYGDPKRRLSKRKKDELDFDPAAGEEPGTCHAPSRDRMHELPVAPFPGVGGIDAGDAENGGFSVVGGGGSGSVERVKSGGSGPAGSRFRISARAAGLHIAKDPGVDTSHLNEQGDGQPRGINWSRPAIACDVSSSNRASRCNR